MFLESSYAWFLNYPLFIQIALVVIVLSVGLFLLANISLASLRIISSYRQFRIQRASTLIRAELTDNLMIKDEVSELDFSRLVKRIKKIVKDKLVKQVVIDQIIFYRRNFTDNTERLLTRLFFKLNLAENSIHKVKKGSWERKAKGLKELQEMTPGPALSHLVDPLLNDKNPDLRIEAQAAYIRINKDNPFGFLLDATEELLEWHQILLYELITNTPDLAKPVLNAHLKSSNPSVVSFSIKLVIYYQLLDAVPVLISLLDHSIPSIREEVVVSLGNLYVEEAESRLIEKFSKEDSKVQSKILTAIGEIASGKQLDFLIEQFLKANEFLLIKAACGALAAYPGFKKNELLNDTREISPLHEMIMNHCTSVLNTNDVG